MVHFRLAAPVVVVLSIACSACGDDTGGAAEYDSCDAADITDALAAAGDGDTVAIGACEVAGPFLVPAGVTLAGEGAEATTVVGTSGVAIQLAAGATGSALRGMTVRSSGAAAIVARGGGAGTADIADVRVEVSAGLGVGVEDVAGVTMSRAVVTGPIVAPADAATVADPSSYGIALIRAGTAVLTDVEVRGFATMGVLAVDTELTWTGGGAIANAGTGLFVRGSATTQLAGLALSGALQGTTTSATGRLLPPYGAVFLGDDATPTHVESTDLVVENNAGTGVLHVGASARHAGLIGTGNGADPSVVGGPALWVENAPFLELAGATLDRNQFGGAIVISADPSITDRVIVSDTTVTNTAAVERPLGLGGAPIIAGDGIAVIRVQEHLEFSDVTLDENGRAGLVIDLGTGDIDAILTNDITEWTRVVISGSGDQVGAVCQGEEPEKEIWGPDLPVEDATWDDGIERQGAIVANDQELNEGGSNTQPQDVVGVSDPDTIPSPFAGISAAPSLGGLGVPAGP